MDIPVAKICLPLIYGSFILGLDRFRPERRLGRLKEFTHYLAVNYAFGHHLAVKVQTAASVEEAWQRAVEFFQRHDAEALVEAGPVVEEVENSRQIDSAVAPLNAGPG